MIDSFRPNRYAHPTLIVSFEDGFLSEIPDEPVVSRGYVGSHPFIRVRYDENRQVEQVVVGDADPIIVYDVVREVAGFLHLRIVREV